MSFNFVDRIYPQSFCLRNRQQNIEKYLIVGVILVANIYSTTSGEIHPRHSLGLWSSWPENGPNHRKRLFFLLNNSNLKDVFEIDKKNTFCGNNMDENKASCLFLNFKHSIRHSKGIKPRCEKINMSNYSRLISRVSQAW